jgi:hypothetical protein
MLPKWKATTSHIFIFFCQSNHSHHTLSTSMSTRPDSPATVIRTTSDVNFEQAQHIVAARITDAIGILDKLCFAIGDRTSSRNKSIFSLFKLSYSNIFKCPRNGVNDNTQQMLPKWKATSSHIFIFFGRINHRHHTLSTSMITHPDSPATVIRTTSNVNFEQAQHIYAVAVRITDAVGILDELCSVIGDRTSSRNKLLKKASLSRSCYSSLFRYYHHHYSRSKELIPNSWIKVCSPT